MMELNSYEAMILALKPGRNAEAARRLYRQMRRRARLGRLWNSLVGSRFCLLDLGQVKGQRPLQSRTDAGLQTVAIKQIRGSVGHGHEFDAMFRPLDARTEHRWLRVAAELQAGKPLPPVRLIRVGDVYFVREGHCAVSVASAWGRVWIDAEVEVWQLAGLLPADKKATAHGRASGSRADATRAKQAGVV